ncbi:MAG: potassium-transporting ATPase subunit KdpA [Armatimonadetes bacterium]|nr:potassium-transporting ATPase subunit KdpA [Armatimonadota bacterium]
MTLLGWAQIALFLALLYLATRPLGRYLARVFAGERNALDRVLGPLERLIYRLAGIDPHVEMHPTAYALALLAFSLVGTLLTYVLLRCQGWLPLNPMGFSTATAPRGATAMTPDLAFNTAVSFATNTNWQAYGGESTLSYLSQMLALAYHNWVSAAAGMAVAVALVRGFARRGAATIGNFWFDLVRATLYVLLPLCVVFSLVLVSQGVAQNLAPYPTVSTLDGGRQTIAMGPVASQEAIKMLGTNGGGFFNANSAHPFENPTPLTNMLSMLSIFLLPAALFGMFGAMVGDERQGWALWAASAVMFLVGVTTVYAAETAGSPLAVRHGVAAGQGNMEGKEQRFGQAQSALFTTVTTAASCGAVCAMHDSLTPLATLVPLVNMQTDEVIFGGVGAGLYGLLIYAVLTVFIAGLMVGRTPEYLGKRIEAREVKLAMLFVLVSSASILCLTALAVSLPGPSSGVLNGGPRGFGEMLYAFSSATGNNGSALAGITANTPFYNVALGLAMLVGRFLMMLPALALAGSLAAKKYTPPSAGTFPTTTGLFVALLVGVIVIVAALTFFPALSLGPILEHGLMHAGRLF